MFKVPRKEHQPFLVRYQDFSLTEGSKLFRQLVALLSTYLGVVFVFCQGKIRPKGEHFQSNINVYCTTTSKNS